MKLRKVTINGKTYYEEIKDDDNVIDPEVVDNRKSQRIKYDSEEDSSSKKSSETMFSKENLKRDWNEFVSSMKGLGTKISKKVKRTTKDWFQDSPATEDTTNRLLKILPYMDKDDIHGIAKRILKNDKEFKDVDYAAIMPFMTRKDCDAIFLKTLKDGDTISIKMVHFVSPDCLSILVDRYVCGKCPDLDIDALYPFLNSADVKKLFYYELKKNKHKR